MHKQFKYKADLILGILTKNHQAHALYQELTGDSNSATNMTEKQVMLRVKQLLVRCWTDQILIKGNNIVKFCPYYYYNEFK